MNPLRKVVPDPSKLTDRLTVLVEVLLVYIVLVTGVGGYYMLGLINSNDHRASDVSQGLERLICGAGLARATSALDHPEVDGTTNVRAALSYYKILDDFHYVSYPKTPLDRYGERCPYPTLTKKAKEAVVTYNRSKS